MKTDLYTKTILTIIAICLSINIVKDFDIIPAAFAGNTSVINDSIYNTSAIDNTYRLVKVSDAETLDVRIVDINTYDELNVNIKSIDSYDEMKVNIKSIDTQDELDVNIDEVAGAAVSTYNPIPVKIKE
jgi:hypothetical protein